uniref:Uncharacterized protein n=1 Tax=uncultured prokaryote TaxID=198431 RepID=A0A0H5Q4W6_9ZZZZ|nr:hypothetical protein [uncultured prokaryote]
MQTGYTAYRPNRGITLSAHALVCHEAFWDAMQDSYSLAWTLERTKAEYLGNIAYAGDVKNNGSFFSPPLLNACFLVAKIPTTSPQGRLYLPGLTQSVMDPDGKLFPSTFADTQDRLNDWIGLLESRGTEMEIIRPQGLFHKVTKLVLKPYAGRQDRRFVRGRAKLIT